MFKPTQTERCIYISVLFSLSNHPPKNYFLQTGADGEPRRKKMRTTFTGRQIFELERMFETKKYLNSGERSHLSRSDSSWIILRYQPSLSPSLSPFLQFPTFPYLLSRFSLLLIFTSSCIYAICIPPQASGGVRAASEDLVPEPSDEVEEAGERGGAAQDGGQQQLDQQQRAWKAGGGLHDQGRISLQRTEQVLEAQRAKGHHNAGA